MSMNIEKLVKGVAITIRESDDLALAKEVMAWGDVRHLPVMGGDALVGVISERDVLRRYADVGRAVAAREKVGTAMSSPPVTIGPNEDVETAIRLVTDRVIGCLPIAEHGRLLGIVTRRDLLAHAFQEDAPEDDRLPHSEARRAPWTTVSVDTVMSRDPLTATADDTMRTILERMGQHGIRHLPVVDGERRVIGLLSDRDVRTAIGNPMRALTSHEAELRIGNVRAADAMTRAPITLREEASLLRAAHLFADFKIGLLPIVDDEKHLRGVLSYTDVLRAILGPKRDAS